MSSGHTLLCLNGALKAAVGCGLVKIASRRLAHCGGGVVDDHGAVRVERLVADLLALLIGDDARVPNAASGANRWGSVMNTRSPFCMWGCMLPLSTATIGGQTPGDAERVVNADAEHV